MPLTLAQAAKWPPRTEPPMTMLSPQWRAALANRPGKVAGSGLKFERGFHARPSRPMSTML